MKYIVILLIIALAYPAFASFSARAGLAGGAFRVSAVMDRPIRENLSVLGDLGYGLGNGYTLVSGGIGITSAIRENIFLGAEATYSSYSTAVHLGLPAVDILDQSGIGLGVFAGLTRDKMYLEAGYDTRMGVLAEAGYVIM